MVGNGGVILVAFVDGTYVIETIKKRFGKPQDPFGSETCKVRIHDDDGPGLEFHGRLK